MSLDGDTSLKLWLADVDRIADALEAAEAAIGLLSTAERAWTTPAPANLRRWRRLTRIALRLLLLRAGAGSARGGELVTDTHGKPRLSCATLAFSVSHSQHLSLIALAQRGPVGVDLEQDREVQLGSTRRALIEAAGRGIAAESLEQSFLHAWTRLEAFAKARGSGIGTLLTDLGITASGSRALGELEVGRTAAALRDAEEVAVVTLDLPAGCYGAIAGPRDFVRPPFPVQTLEAESCRLAIGTISATAR